MVSNNNVNNVNKWINKANQFAEYTKSPKAKIDAALFCDIILKNNNSGNEENEDEPFNDDKKIGYTLRLSF